MSPLESEVHMSEIWCVVSTFPGYMVSNRGRVKNRRRKRLKKPVSRKDGYVQITLHDRGRKKTFGLHRLVLIAFTGTPPEGEEVHHLDCNKGNNSLANLVWVTPEENRRLARAAGRVGGARGEKNSHAK